jgi:hypothetical protein
MVVKFTDLQLIYGQAGAREKFEELAAHLIRSERPDVERLRIVHGDSGIDAHEGALSDTAGVDVYQIKFFLEIRDSQKAQIRESFNQAFRNGEFSMKSWTLCLPIEMSLDEKKWFEMWKARQESKTGIKIRAIWGASRLEELLLQEKNRHLKESYFDQRKNRPLRIRCAFAASIVFNEAENLPQMFFDMDSEVGQRLASKSSFARPYRNVDGEAVLTVQVPITNEQKFLYCLDALQCKLLVDICRAQRGGSIQQWSASKGISSTKLVAPYTPEPITRLPGKDVLHALAQNGFGQSDMVQMEFEYSAIPFPCGTSIRLEARPSSPSVGPAQRSVVVAVPGIATITVSIEPLPSFGTGALPQGASVPDAMLSDCRTFIFSVELYAEIIRLGNHDDVVEDYKAWIEWLVNQLQSHNAD